MSEYEEAQLYLNSLSLNRTSGDSADYKIIGFIMLWMVCNQKFKEREESCDVDKFRAYFVEHAIDYTESHSEKIKNEFAATKTPPRTAVKDMRSTSGRKVKLLDANEQLTTSNLAKVLYQIRCNLFHGEKDFLDNTEDRALVSWAYDILAGVFLPGQNNERNT